MPTATTTLTAPTHSIIPLKASLALSPPTPPSPSSPATTTIATLRSLYNRAARAFLHRDVSLTHSLLESAFALLLPPTAVVDDGLAQYRRKWDILRITLDTTVYASPPTLESLPPSLRDNHLQSPQSFLTSLYNRSLSLFHPTAHSHKSPSAAFLPSQILVTLVLSSLKLDVPDVGRGMVEDWLACRGRYEEVEGGEGYEKVLEIYCLHVLPQLDQWDYAKEFLEYEGEMLLEHREGLKSSLASLHSQHLSAQPSSARSTLDPRSVASSSNPTQRATSPTPSTSSSSSSLSTTSTHTAVPSTPRPSNPLTPLTSLSSASLASDDTITHRSTSRSKAKSAVNSNGHAISRNSNSPSPHNTLPRPPRTLTREMHLGAPARTPLSTYALLRATLTPYLTTPKLTSLIFLFVVFPIVSLLLRLRRRRLAGSVSSTSGTSGRTDLVRRRLLAVKSETAGFGMIGKVWSELVRAVIDTVRMGGSGLV